MPIDAGAPEARGERAFAGAPRRCDEASNVAER